MTNILEEILEAIWKAGEEGAASIDHIRRCCPKEILEKDLCILENQHYIAIADGSVTFTESGREEARTIVRRHRLAEVLLATVLNLDPETRERIACEVEHSLLPEMEEAICTLLGHPPFCPDGKAIPEGRCCTLRRTTAPAVVRNLTELEPGERGRIMYITPKHHARLHRLSSFGLTPGTVVELHQRSPAFCIRYEGTEIAINRDVAEDIYVAKVKQ
jgi:DtxR family transcriptional regulator, Mn-dependent transcriptional regulator